ncbi:MAG: hypothetical protein ACFFFH_09200 [Candidatus Thorarchaeota archaeon]
MKIEIPCFYFEHLPKTIDKTGIKVLKCANETYSLEYVVFDPGVVHITMYPVIRRPSLKKVDTSIATIQQFASAMGLHNDFHKTKFTDIQLIFDILKSTFQIGSDGPKFYSGGFTITRNKPGLHTIATEGFIDNLLEILSDKPQFAFVQFVFKPMKIPKKFQINDDQNKRLTRVRFDIQQGKVEYTYPPPNTNALEETGCFQLSTRLLVVETNPESLKSKLDRTSVLFLSNDFNVLYYPTFWKRFSSLINLCRKRKLVSPIMLDGSSLMNLIAPPQRQISCEGYTFVPDKMEYVSSKLKR